MRKIYLFLVFIFTPFIFSQTQAFHDTQGKFDVSQSGQATYTLPVALPPSIQDVGPTINLVYASGQMGGIAGQGWNISAISNICRIATRKDIDGFVDGVDFDDNDKLALDGQRLLIKTGTYWADGSIYETEVQSNTKIKLIGTGASITFEVTSPDGSISQYGGVGSTDLTSYYITKFEDTKGNFITYEYNTASPNAIPDTIEQNWEIIDLYTEQPQYGFVDYLVPGISSSNSLTIKQINFSANTISNKTPLNAINFTYKKAARYEEAYLKGEKIKKIDILDKIEVWTNSLLFKKYQLTHVVDELGYQRVTKLQEFNGVDVVGANPVLFEYNSTTNDTYYSVKEPSTGTLDNITTSHLNGDFSGEGDIDFIKYNILYINAITDNPVNVNMPFTSQGNTYNINTLVDNQLTSKNSILNIVKDGANAYLNTYHLSNNVVQSIFNKTILNIEIDGSKNLIGDFNGDGISEVLIVKDKFEDETYTTFTSDYDGNVTGEYESTQSVYKYSIANLIDLNPNASVIYGTSGNVSFIFDVKFDNLTYVMDFNGDGKDDIMVIYGQGFYLDAKYKIFTFSQLNAAPWITCETIGQGTIAGFNGQNSSKPLVFGDYNGDSKIDFMIPTNIGSSSWIIYYSNPKLNNLNSFFDFETKTLPLIYNPYSAAQNGNWTDWEDYFAMDVNKDGKSDLISLKRSIYKKNGSRYSFYQIKSFVKNQDNFLLNSDTGEETVYGNEPWKLIATNQKNRYLLNDIVLSNKENLPYTRNYLSYIKFNKNVNFENSLSKITQSNGAIIDQIAYKPFEINSFTTGTSTYSHSNSTLDKPAYPFGLIRSMPNSFIVSGILNNSLGVTKTQILKYQGLLTNYHGLGVIGFKKFLRSNWFTNLSNEKITYNLTENNPIIRGATILSSAFLLDFNTIFDFNADYNNFRVSQSVNEYNIPLPPTTFPYVLTLKKQTVNNNLTNTTTEKSFIYSTDGFYLPTETTTKNYLGTTLQGTSVSKTTYSPNSLTTGSNYYIGRPESTTEINTAYGDTKSARTSLTYVGSNVQTITKTVGTTEASLATATEKIIETMDYFPNGNLKSKTLSATGFNAAAMANIVDRTTSYTYDTSNRFVKESTDIDLLVSTNNTYDPIYGVVTKQTNAFGQSTISTYDAWGKRTMITDFLGKTLKYDYTRTGNEYTTTETGADGSESKSISDALGRVFKKGSKDLNGNWNFVNTDYNWKGQIISVSEPYRSTTSPNYFSTSEYDDYGRTTTVTAHTGQVTTYTYTGLTTSVFDGLITKTATKNGNGHTTRSTDTPGGTINYTYNANGNLLVSDYDGVVMRSTYDLWGRKTKLNDPSAGEYTDEYNAYSELLKETNPKGFTEYTYTATGKPLTKWIKDAPTPVNTNIKSDFTYYGDTKLLESIRVSNPIDGNSSYRYEYDTVSINRTFQLMKTTENQLGLGTTFAKELTFDGFGRPLTVKSTASIAGNTSNTTIYNEYKNGALYCIRNGDANGVVISKTIDVNARGQLTSAIMNNDQIAIANEYDEFGYNKKITNHIENSIGNILEIDYDFEPIRGNLKSRKNGFFGNIENFHYDNNDRLDGWQAPLNTALFYNFDSGLGGFTTSNNSIENSNGQLKVRLYNGDKLKKTIIDITTLKDYGSGYPERVFGIEFDIDFDQLLCNPALPWYMNGCNTASLHYKVLYKDFATGNTIVLSDEEITTEGHQFMYNTVATTGQVSIEFYMVSIGAKETQFKFKLDNFSYRQYEWPESQTYDDRGRIIDNVLGNYRYKSLDNRPYAHDKLKLTNDGLDHYANNKHIQNITYNAFKCPVKIVDADKKAIYFGYNAFQQRSVMYYGDTQTDKLLQPQKRYYSADGSMEINYTPETATAPAGYEFTTYIGGDAYSAPALSKQQDNQAASIFYLHRDMQGSILAISTSDGTVVEKRMFDPWGNIVQVQDGMGNKLDKLTFTDRGYTGHEHLQGVALINMNARLYDPQLRRFLQTDNELQDPTKTQDYNRYGYCLNNPLKYIDPSGNNPFVIAMIIAAAVHVGTALIFDQHINAMGLIQATFAGGLSGGVSFGIGDAVKTIGNFFVRSTVQAVAHGIFNGGMYALQGGNFWNGFAAGSISSLASSLWAGGSSFGADGKAIANSGFGGIGGSGGASMIAFGTIAGGAGAALTGGNFWQGAVTGLVVSGLNHAGHKIDNEDGDPVLKKNDAKKEILEAGIPVFLDDEKTILNSDRGNAYNCHSYAWSNSEGDPTDPSNKGMLKMGVPKWDNNPGNNKSGYHPIPFNSRNQVGDRLVYYAWDSASRRVLAQHSAIVTKVNSAGQAIRLTSKWGESNLYSHHPRDIPASYGSVNPTFVAPNGATYPSRIYYRKN